MKNKLLFLVTIASVLTLCGCNNNHTSDVIKGGYSEEVITFSKEDGPHYIGGYTQGQEITGVLDYQYAKAFYLNYYGNDVLMISIDAIGLSSDYVAKIRKGINYKCPVNVMSTHTHAGIDTLGLWGKTGFDGKNKAFNDRLVKLAVKAGNDAINNALEGKLTYGKIKTEGILRDSREPYVYDENIYQLKFIPINGANTRMMFFGAHAESLRGDNTLLSADFPSVIAKNIKEKTGDNFIFFNGAIGGLIMTKIFDDQDNINNMKITGDKISEYLLNIKEEEIKTGNLKYVNVKFKVQLDNVIYRYYKFLGILNNKTTRNIFTGKYYFHTELSILKISNLYFGLIPGEIFPELVTGGSFINPNVNNKNPDTLKDIASRYNIDNLIIVGLANDEIGYIVPPSDYVLDKDYPYLKTKDDEFGENHYEETNSPSIDAAYKVAKYFEKACNKISR